MARDNMKKTLEQEGDDEEEEDEVDFERQIIGILKDLKVKRGNVKTLEAEQNELKEHAKSLNKKIDESKNTIINLKVQLEESKKNEELLKRELEERNKEREYLQAEIVSLWKEAQKRNVQQNFENNSKELDELINSHRPCSDKIGLGYRQAFMKGSSSLTTEKGDKQKTYAEITKGFVEKEERFPAEQKVQETYNQQPKLQKSEEGPWRTTS